MFLSVLVLFTVVVDSDSFVDFGVAEEEEEEEEEEAEAEEEEEEEELPTAMKQAELYSNLFRE